MIPYYLTEEQEFINNRTVTKHTTVNSVHTKPKTNKCHAVPVTWGREGTRCRHFRQSWCIFVIFILKSKCLQMVRQAKIETKESSPRRQTTGKNKQKRTRFREKGKRFKTLWDKYKKIRLERLTYKVQRWTSREWGKHTDLNTLGRLG